MYFLINTTVFSKPYFLIYLLITIVMLFISGIRYRWFGILGGIILGFIAFVLIIYFVNNDLFIKIFGLSTNNFIGNFIFNDYSSNVFSKNLDKFDINTTKAFSDEINLVIETNKKFIPKFIDNSFDYLKKLSITGLKKRLNNNVSDIYKKRLLYELKKNMSKNSCFFAPFFV